MADYNRDDRNDDRNNRNYGKKPYGGGNRGSGPRGGGYGRGPRRNDDRGDRPRYNDKPRRDFNDKPRRDYGDRPRRDYGDKPRHDRDGESGDRPRYNDRPRRDYGDRPRRDYNDKPRRDYGDKPRRDYGDRPRRDYGDKPRYDRDGEGRSEDRPRYSDRPRRDFNDKPRRDYGDRPRRDRGDRSGGDRHGRSGGYQRRDRYDDRDRSTPVFEEPQVQETVVTEQEYKLTIPSDPQKILFKGIDCQVNGRDDIALILFLHGAVGMSKGCENNAITMMRGMDHDTLVSTRASIADKCTPQAMVEYDYICLTMDKSSERRFLEGMYSDRDPHAVYCMMRLEEVQPEDPVIEEFASNYDSMPDKVTDGLIFMKRRMGSEKAEECLKMNEQRKALRMSIRNVFAKAVRGDAASAKKMEELASIFPEARFLCGYLDARADGVGVEYLKNGYHDNGKFIVAMSADLDIADDPFGMFLRAKRLQADKEDWIRFMIDAAKAGSDEALDELKPVQNRADVRKAFSSIYLARGDAENLVRQYDGEDSYYLDQYCAGDPDKIEAVGKLMNGEKEIDWLKRNYRAGVEECRDALVAMAADESRHSKRLVYALHDVGADMDAAKLWFAMGDDPTLPSYKWLGKVCESDDVKEYVKEQFEARGDLETFEAIFVDDGYTSRGSNKGGRGRPDGRRGGRRY